uniref:Peptidase S1 domain-containing protein n=1 Tax=Bombyx mori TaxID=7091 RepID=A0A8R2R7R7_BOMMO|nr:CLIP domain-containing serine protease 2-like [Bombyx mori]XP_037877140.1 CLIP domain-containing serine protease 2-like [Bombyx mori]
MFISDYNKILCGKMYGLSKVLFLIGILVCTNAKDYDKHWALIGNPLLHAAPCIGNSKVSISYEPGLAPEEETKYNLFINGPFPEHTTIKMKFDSPANVTLSNDVGKLARVSSSADGMFFIKYFKGGPYFSADVIGLNLSVVPYPTTINLNFVEYCEHPALGILDGYINGYKSTASSTYTEHDDNCGRIKISEKQCGGNEEEPMPWHALIRDDNSTICAGTLILQRYVLTAAQCVTNLGVAKNATTLSVVLGKFNNTSDECLQEMEVETVFVYDGYNYENGTNNIALLELKNDVVFNEKVQPACLWEFSAYKKLNLKDIKGSVISTTLGDDIDEGLEVVNMKKLKSSKEVNVYREEKFGSKFNATSINQSEACKLVGSGFMVFVPDSRELNSTGAWYIHGIVATNDSTLRCDSSDPTDFINLDYFRGWVLNKKNRSYSIY